MKKIISVILALLTVFLSLSACAKEQISSVETGETNTTEAETKDYFYGDLPTDVNYDGYNFVIMTPSPSELGSMQYDREETTGDTINDAIYNRNAEVEEMYSITISTLEAGDSGTQAPQLSKYVMSSDTGVDIVACAYTQSARALIIDDLLTTWNDVPYIDYDKEWWNHNITDTLSLAGKIFLLVGDINWYHMPTTMVCYFNKQATADYNIGDMYQVVKDGQWTFNKLYTLASGFSKDVNGDGEWTKADQYGCVQNLGGSVSGFLYAADVLTVTKGDTGPVMHFTDEKTVDIVNYVYKLLYEINASYVENFSFINDSKGVPIFFDNGALFYFDVLIRAEAFRDQDNDFGIIPYPKYDETQENYTTISDQWGLSCTIPAINNDLERTGLIVEALCAASRKYIVPAYYDKVLTGKLIRDTESGKMLDIIFKNEIYDFGLCYADDLNYIPLMTLMQSKNSDIITWYTKREKKITKNYQDLYDYIVDDSDVN